jgi:hypothetical protein
VQSSTDTKTIHKVHDYYGSTQLKAQIKAVPGAFHRGVLLEPACAER